MCDGALFECRGGGEELEKVSFINTFQKIFVRKTASSLPRFPLDTMRLNLECVNVVIHVQLIH